MKPFFCFFFSVLMIIKTTISNDHEARLTHIFEENNLMGLSVLAIFDGQVVYSAQRGLANFETGKEINENTLFRFASVSKTITAMAFMKLCEKRLITLDTDISVIMGFKVRNPNHPDIPITPRMLLSHTSTIGDGAAYSTFLMDQTYNNPDPPSLKEVLHPGGKFFHKTIWLDEEPGTFFSYSNLAYGLAGTVIEKVSGQRFDHFVNEHILDLMAISGGFNVAELANIDQLAILYRKPDHEWVPQADNFTLAPPPAIDYTNYLPGTNALVFAPQGGLRISIVDLAKILNVLMNDGLFGNEQILAHSSIAAMEELNWQFDGHNGNTNNNMFNAWGTGLHFVSQQSNGDIAIPGYSMYGHAGLAYGLVSGMYYHRNPDFGLIIVINGKAGPFTPGKYSAFHREEEELYHFLYEEIIAPLLK